MNYNYNYDTNFLRFKVKNDKYKVINKNNIVRIDETDYNVDTYEQGNFVIVYVDTKASSLDRFCFKGRLENLKDYFEPFYI